MPPLCPGFGHQSLEEVNGNNFRFWRQQVLSVIHSDATSMPKGDRSTIR